MESNSPSSIYVGFVNSDRTEGRGNPKPAVVGLDFATVEEQAVRRAGYTGHIVCLYAIAANGLVQVSGYWHDELGKSHCGPLPAQQPEKWGREKVREFEALAKRFPNTALPDLTDRPLLVDTQPKPSTLRHGPSSVFLVVLQTVERIGDYSYPRARLEGVFGSRADAVARAASVRRDDLTKSLKPNDRLHVVQVSLDVDARPWTTIDLDDVALGMCPRPAVGESGWMDWDGRVSAKSKQNAHIELVWSEADADKAPDDADLARYRSMIAELGQAGVGAKSARRPR